MKTLLIVITLLFLSGCSQLAVHNSISLGVECESMLGKVGNSCTIHAPATSDIHVNGDTIEIIYEGLEL